MAHLLGFEIVGIVISAAEHEASQQNSALHLFAEPFGTGFEIELFEILDILGPVAVAHPVVAA